MDTKIIDIRNKALQSRHAIELLANKWRITVLHILRDGPLRAGQIQGAMPKVSPKVLTQTLRGMERDGLLYREILRVIPARVEYGLTPMGTSLVKPLQDLCRWAKEHLEERDSARVRFDAMKNAPSESAARGVRKKSK